MSLATTAAPVSLLCHHCSSLRRSTSLRSSSLVLATSSRQQTQVRSAVTRLLYCSLSGSSMARVWSSWFRNPWFRCPTAASRALTPPPTGSDAHWPLHLAPSLSTSRVRFRGLGVSGASEGEREQRTGGLGMRECRVSQNERPLPFCLFYFFSLYFGAITIILTENIQNKLQYLVNKF